MADAPTRPRPPRRSRGMTVTIDGQEVPATPGDTVLDTARRAGIPIPTLCWLDGLSVHGGCRVCVVEIAEQHRLAPACATTVVDEMEITTASPSLVEHRRRLVELLLAEGNHICSVCVANGACELQDLAESLGIDHVRYPYQFPELEPDASHRFFVFDPNRCILCTRCVRTCAEIEGAFVWEVASRGEGSHLVTDLDRPWGGAPSCTSCGKCVESCPTGALYHKGNAVGESRHDADVIAFLSAARAGGWHDRGAQA
ncbi:bidirectional hydrogenase complex protein HoxU [Euzebya sp.]|uniref:bidirectional hydrogenase complex protein HoxU n=1 Tax=Euzebya sp. TaxID=1971409 RepID=UPI003512F6EF